MYSQDSRIIMTLDAGGTNLVFSAIQAGHRVIDNISLHSEPNDLEQCLERIVSGFKQVRKSILAKFKVEPVAISFAFPGPADYKNGVIGDLPNFPSFRGGVALGPYLEKTFNLPTFINNDGNLYAYGEALFGILPSINNKLSVINSGKIAETEKVFQYKNLIGITLGTGFGCGVVIDNQLLLGDNGCGGDLWHSQNAFNPKMIAEEDVSIRGIKRLYKENLVELGLSDYVSKNATELDKLTPKDICEIADLETTENSCLELSKSEKSTLSKLRKLDAIKSKAARKAFYRMGQVAGRAVVNALNIVDGLVVFGGGVTGASRYILPGVMAEMNSQLQTYSGDKFPSLEVKAYNLTDKEDTQKFLANEISMVKMPGFDVLVPYKNSSKIGVAISEIGANEAIALGAYAFALHEIDTKIIRK